MNVVGGAGWYFFRVSLAVGGGGQNKSQREEQEE